MPKPFLKWAGGKRQLLKEITELISGIETRDLYYYEPFLGAGSVFFALDFKKAIVNDLNEELINTYEVIRDNVDDLIGKLKLHEENHLAQDSDYYYKIRMMDRELDFYSKTSKIERAARTIYLNKTCYNGLYRVNSKGQFNTPIGRYKDPKIVDVENLKSVSHHLRTKNVSIKNETFQNSLKNVPENSLIYFDPPYDYENENGFVAYHKEGFGEKELIELRNIAKKLILKGCYVVISNHYTSRVKKLFNDEVFAIKHKDEKESFFLTKRVQANRMINSKSQSRKTKVEEVLIYGSNLPTSR